MLKLTVIEAPPDETPVGATKVLGPAGGTVGRTQDNDWTLTDEDSLLSRSHFKVVFEDAAYTLVDTSTNGSFINDAREPVGRGNRAPIQDGDTIRIGGYRISVALESLGQEPPPLEGGTPDFLLSRGAEAPAPEPPIAFEPADTPPPGPEQSAGAFEGVKAQPLGDGLFGKPLPARSPRAEPLFGSNPLGDSPISVPTPDVPTPGVPAPGASPLAGVPDAAPPDPEGIAPARLTPAFDTPPAADRAFASRALDSPPAGNDDFALKVPVADSPSPAADLQAGADDGLIPDDWWVDEPLLTPGASPPAAESQNGADAEEPAAPPEAPAKLPGVKASTESGRPAARDDAAPPSEGIEAELRAALRAALGTHVDGLGSRDLLQVVEELAAMTRVSIPRMMQALGSRTEFKDQLRLDQTMVRPRDNNPMKFCESAEEALQHMLLNDHPGLLRGRQAMEEAFHELATHQSALLGALPAALRDTVNQFAPATVEAAAGGEGLAAFNLGKGKSKLWDTYRELYAKLAESDQGLLERVFMKALAQYYENSLRAMK